MKERVASGWSHPALAVRGSGIAGQGLFAVEPIARGTVVARLGGRKVSTAVLQELLDGQRAVDSITVDRRCAGGLVTGEDWQRPELQERYGDHWIPLLLKRQRGG